MSCPPRIAARWQRELVAAALERYAVEKARTFGFEIEVRAEARLPRGGDSRFPRRPGTESVGRRSPRIRRP